MEATQKPWKSYTLTNQTLVVVTNEGMVYVKTNATVEDIKALKDCSTEDDLLNLIMTDELKVEKQKKQDEIKEIEEENKKAQIVIDNFSLIKESNDFIVNSDNSVYLKGLNRSLPNLLIEQFIQILTGFKNFQEEKLQISSLNKYIALKRFWYWCCLNPYTKVCDWLYDFLKKGDFKITKDGMFLAYRRVKKINDKDTSLVHEISNNYIKVKTKFKKSPINFELWKKDMEHKVIDLKKQHTDKTFEGWELVGNLQELYLNLSDLEENEFTDAHTGTFSIKIGKEVTMPRSDCNHSTKDCNTGGLHFCSKLYDYSSYGEQSILVLINPYNIVGIGSNKGRTCAYLPLMTLSESEATTILSESDFDTTQLEEYYAEEQLKDLEERIKDDYIAEIKTNTFELPKITAIEVEEVIYELRKPLEEIKSELSSRIINI